MPAPTLRCSGSRRVEAFWMRMISTDFTSWQTEVMVSGSLSITKPGLTPVPRSATFVGAGDLLQLLADLARRAGTRALRTSRRRASRARAATSSWPATSRRREPVEWQTTSGLPCSSAVTMHAGLASEADHLAEVLADLVRVDVDGADELDPRLGEEQARDLRADRADAVLRDSDGLV